MTSRQPAFIEPDLPVLTVETSLAGWFSGTMLLLTNALVFFHLARVKTIEMHPSIACVVAVSLICLSVIMLIWALVTLPLTVVGGIIGRNTASGRPFALPVRVNKIPREIPPIPWYRQGACQVFMAGFLPFSAIYIELHYIFASVWGHKLYTL